ncbi:MAG TPA: methionine--tRNA ligase [Candidatus Saccharimonadales bacterium]|nr:methionine--tRNA ligase [Candidatus Saccharimonadales bacterium]
MDKKKFFVTTPIYYVNDVAHIGHAYATIAADILARFHRNLGEEVFFLTGLDENSQKTVAAAEKAGKSLEDYTNDLATKWQETWKNLAISNDDFIRTTEPRHKKIVEDFFKKVFEKGDIYKGKYEGLYCVGHEAFLRKEDLDEGGLCPDHKTKPEHLSEENYFFRLSNYQGQLLKFYQENPNFIEPKERYNEVVKFVESGLQDISVTRANQKWGISAPNDSSQVIYVWFDALINYLSADPGKWPADLHIIGKDILRFHAIIWPAMLLSADYPLPKKIFAHGFFTVDGVKISKSLGNSIDPVEIAKEYGNDSLRYFLFHEFPFGNDGDFSFERLREVYNSDLANGLGNLVSRVATLAQKLDLDGLKIPEKPLLDSTFRIHLEKLEFLEALDYIWDKIRKVDKSIEQNKPWETLKEDPEKAKAVVENLLRQIVEIKELIEPFLPETATKITEQFSGLKIVSQKPLFPRK